MRRYSWAGLRSFLIDTTIPRWRALDPEILAAGLSYFALFSLAPLLFVVLTVGTHVMSLPTARQVILDRASLWMTDEASDTLDSWMSQPTPHHSKSATFLGLLVAAWAGSQVLGYMKRILNRIWETRSRKSAPFWKDYLLSTLFNFFMLGILGFFLTFSLILDAMGGALWKFFRDILPSHIIHAASWLQGINFAVSLFCFCLLFGMIYRFIPDASMAWEDVWAGALVTSILLAIGKVVLSLYLTFATFASGYGAAGSILIVLFSIYIGAQIFIFGGVFTRTYAEYYGSRKHLRKKI